MLIITHPRSLHCMLHFQLPTSLIKSPPLIFVEFLLTTSFNIRSFILGILSTSSHSIFSGSRHTVSFHNMLLWVRTTPIMLIGEWSMIVYLMMIILTFLENIKTRKFIPYLQSILFTHLTYTPLQTHRLHALRTACMTTSSKRSWQSGHTCDVRCLSMSLVGNFFWHFVLINLHLWQSKRG